MACSRCKERQAAIVRAVRAIGTGNAKAVITTEASFVVKSAAQDAANAFRQKTTAAKTRLMRR